MEFISYNVETCIVQRTAKSYIGFNTENGVFRLSGELCTTVGIKEGSKPSFHQSKKHPEDWYLRADDPKGFTIRSKDNVIKNGFIFNNVTLAKRIAASVDFKEVSGQILLGTEPVIVDGVKYWPLITKALFKAKAPKP